MNLVVLVDENWAIGKNGDQFVRIKDDLKRFKELTDGTIVLYGRKTLETFPGGRILPGRENWILSRNPDLHVEGARIFNNIEDVIAAIKEEESIGNVVSCVGGGQIYEQLLPYTDTAYVTKVEKSYEGTDVFFPNLDESDEWEISNISDERLAGKDKTLKYRYVDYKRI